MSQVRQTTKEKVATLLKIERHLLDTVRQVGGSEDPCKLRGEQDDYGNYFYYIDIGRKQIGIKKQVQLAAVLINNVRETPFSKPIRDLGYYVNKIHVVVYKNTLCYLFTISPLTTPRTKKSA